MGMSGGDVALLGSVLGGSVLSNLFAPEGQEVRSFADEPDAQEVHPSVLLQQMKELLTEFRQPLMQRIDRGIDLPSAFVQQPGVYMGGGLPFPIGVVATDPAWNWTTGTYNDNGLLHKDGPRELSGDDTNSTGPYPLPPYREPTGGGGGADGDGPNGPLGGNRWDGEGPDPWGGDPNPWRGGNPAPGGRTPTSPTPTPTYPGGGGGDDPGGDDPALFSSGMGADDLDAGLGAVDLLLQLHGGGDSATRFVTPARPRRTTATGLPRRRSVA